jgi:hypothetical protein
MITEGPRRGNGVLHVVVHELHPDRLSPDAHQEAHAIVDLARERLDLREAVDQPHDRGPLEGLAGEEIEVLAASMMQVESRQGRAAAQVERVGKVAGRQSIQDLALAWRQVTRRHPVPRTPARPPRTIR